MAEREPAAAGQSAAKSHDEPSRQPFGVIDILIGRKPVEHGLPNKSHNEIPDHARFWPTVLRFPELPLSRRYSEYSCRSYLATAALKRLPPEVATLGLESRAAEETRESSKIAKKRLGLASSGVGKLIEFAIGKNAPPLA